MYNSCSRCASVLSSSGTLLTYTCALLTYISVCELLAALLATQFPALLCKLFRSFPLQKTKLLSLSLALLCHSCTLRATLHFVAGCSCTAQLLVPHIAKSRCLGQANVLPRIVAGQSARCVLLCVWLLPLLLPLCLSRPAPALAEAAAPGQAGWLAGSCL